MTVCASPLVDFLNHIYKDLTAKYVTAYFLNKRMSKYPISILVLCFWKWSHRKTLNRHPVRFIHIKSTGQIKKPSKFASEWLGTSAKWPEGTGSKNTSQLSDLSLELMTEEQ